MFFGLVDQCSKFFIGEVRGFFALFFKLIGGVVVFFENFFNTIQVARTVISVGKQMCLMVEKANGNYVLVNRIIDFW